MGLLKWPLALLGFAATVGFYTVTIPYMLHLPILLDCLRVKSRLVPSPLGSIIRRLPLDSSALSAFMALFAFRYLRLVVHIISFWLYRPAPIPNIPSITAQDVTVVIPTLEPESEVFLRCLQSICVNKPGRIFVVTVGENLRVRADGIMNKLIRPHFPDVETRVCMTKMANKREQIASIIQELGTQITVLADASVIWRPRFLRSGLAPFEDSGIGLVGTNKRVSIRSDGTFMSAFWNFLGCIYLERHNFEIRSSNVVDGGVFVISGRTCLIRTGILQDPEFLSRYTREYIFFDLFGPVAPDDDNYIHRFCVKKYIGVKFQWDEDACIGVDPLGEAGPRFRAQCLRWARTTPRSNLAILRVLRTWYRQPWSVYAVYVTLLWNYAFLMDGMLMYLLLQSPLISQYWPHLLGWIVASKMVKLMAHFCRKPSHLIFFPMYVLWAYYHGFIKLGGLMTFYSTAWNGRKLEDFGDETDGIDKPKEPTLPTVAPKPEDISVGQSAPPSNQTGSFGTARPGTYPYGRPRRMAASATDDQFLNPPTTAPTTLRPKGFNVALG